MAIEVDRRLHPGGMAENSPTFQRWVHEVRRSASPEGTAENCATPRSSLRDLFSFGWGVPNVETFGYCHISLREEEWALRIVRVRILVIRACALAVALGLICPNLRAANFEWIQGPGYRSAALPVPKHGKAGFTL